MLIRIQNIIMRNYSYFMNNCFRDSIIKITSTMLYVLTYSFIEKEWIRFVLS
jgi:hypothetical protein